MLVEAIKASLAEAAKNGLVDVTPQNSQELPQNLPNKPSPGENTSPLSTLY